jgi:hypothetical protein
MTAATKELRAEGPEHTDPYSGLSGCHGYSILGVYEVYTDYKGNLRFLGRNGRKGKLEKLRKRGKIDESKGIERLVQLRNPWGKDRWKLEFSLESEVLKANPEFKEAGHFELFSENGIFYMPYSRFLEFFHNYTICYFYDEFVYSAQAFESEPCAKKEEEDFADVTILKFEIKKKGKYFFSLSQVNKRLFPKNSSKHKFLNKK